MKWYKRAAALLFAAAVILSTAACHQANETVMTVGDVSISSSLYLALQLEAFSSFSSGVNESLGADETVSNPTDYLSKTLDDLPATEWIQQKSQQLAKEYAVTLTQFNQHELSFTDEELSSIDFMVDYYWAENNYASFYEPNGVSKATYKEAMMNSYRQNKLFLYYYDQPDETTKKGGLKAVPAEDVMARLGESYLQVENIAVSLTPTQTAADGNATPVELTDEEKEALQKKLDLYARRINRGTATFDQIQEEYNTEMGIEDTTPDAAATPSDGEVSLHPNASVLSATESDSAQYTLFKTATEHEDFAYGTAYFIGGDDAYYLAVFHDVTKDSYTAKQYRSAVLYDLKDDEFRVMLDEESAKLTTHVDNGRVKYYSPKKIDFGTQT